MGDSAFVFDLDQLPVAGLATRDSVFVAVNAAFERLTGWKAADLVGKHFVDLLGKIVAPRDRAVMAHLAKNRESAAPQHEGSVWCRILTANGEERPMRVEWRLAANGRDTITLLLDAHPEAFGQEVTEALARAAGAFSRSATEQEVLERAVDAVCERGFTATILLWDEDDPLLRYGPSRSPGVTPAPLTLPRPPRDILTRLNPGYLERRAAYFQDGVRIVREAYPEPVAERLLALVPARRMVQAPLFLGNAPYGALVVTGEALSPLLATALDLFAELVGKAIEAVRLRQERVDRERMAALGEAAAVMAHEVRNPVAAIMNALVLLDRAPRDSADAKTLLSIISEETLRLEQLVNQLLELGRPLLPRPCAFSLEALAERAVRLAESRGELADRMLEMPETEGTMAWLDPGLAELALVNVVKNAAQSTHEQGQIRVAVEAHDTTVRIVVEDDGPGIPPEVEERLGQPFVTTRATGTGMGFAVVRRIMDASGGRVLVESSPLGGALVALEFPRPRDGQSVRGS